MSEMIDDDERKRRVRLMYDPNSNLMRAVASIVANLLARPKMFGSFTIVVRDGKIDHVRTEMTEKIEDIANRQT